jgi:hypothetical protein
VLQVRIERVLSHCRSWFKGIRILGCLLLTYVALELLLEYAVTVSLFMSGAVFDMVVSSKCG